MSTHQFNEQMLPDDLFSLGELKHLRIGNECRLLDKRRTPGFIKSIDMDAGFFRWEISDFEDQGQFWDVEFEHVGNYQFQNNSRELNSGEVEKLSKRIESLNNFIEVKSTDVIKHQNNESIKLATVEILNWLDRNSEFFQQTSPIDFQSLIGLD